MTYRSWKDYLYRHKSNKDLNENADILHQRLKACTTPELCFGELAKQKTVVCLTRSPFSEEIQATFNHETVSTSLQQTGPTYYGLRGFGKRAKAVRLNIARHFKRTTEKKIPSYEDLLECKNKDEVIKKLQKRNQVSTFSQLSHPS